MRADYDSTANAISMAITDAQHANWSDEVHPRAIVAVAAGTPVEVQLLYPDMGIAEPLTAVADRYELDLEALHAAAQSALAAPDRVVVLEVSARAPASTAMRLAARRSGPTGWDHAARFTRRDASGTDSSDIPFVCVGGADDLRERERGSALARVKTRVFEGMRASARVQAC
jgi:hypothetical protein